jgi:hypothetical protein
VDLELAKFAGLYWKRSIVRRMFRDMEVTLFNYNNDTFTMGGECPHCQHQSAFLHVTTSHVEGALWVAGMQCQACGRYILALARFLSGLDTLYYQEHYPLGAPNDTVADEIPEHIKPDFKEALRCFWVKAYNATAEMCRRAVEASCLDLGAKGRNLDDMIDSLEDQRRITPFLQQVAHKIRLGGNRGAHPPDGQGAVLQPPVTPQSPSAGPITTIEEEHAEAIVKFTREFFHHVYVVPKELAKYDFSKPKTAKQ